MTTLTRNKVQQVIDAADAVITALAGTNEDVHPDNSTKMVQLYDALNDDYAPPEVVKALACIVLTSMEQEPKYWLSMHRFQSYLKFNKADAERDVAENGGLHIVPLYTAPPAPAVPDERAAFNKWNNDDNLPIAGVGAKNAAWLAWQARATLCAHSALMVPPELPADSSSGDDVEAWFDEGWNACRVAMLQGKAEPVSNRDELNSPGIQDGWKLVPLVAFPSQWAAGKKAFDSAGMNKVDAVYKAMVAAAPDFREIANSSTDCPRCGGRGTYHCPQMLGTVECECTLPTAPQQDKPHG